MHFPVVITAWTAMMREEFLMHGATASTGGYAVLVVLNGPIRGELGAGPNRMNVAVVRATAAGIARWVREPDRGVVIGRDGRRRSEDFGVEVARVLSGAGIPALVLPDMVPTPVLAFAVRHLGAAAGVMVTASHNPPSDNGLKVYGDDGAQIVPPSDPSIPTRISARPSSRAELAFPGVSSW